MQQSSYLALLTVLLAMAQPALAQRFDDKVSLKVEAYFPKVDSFVQVGTSDGEVGTGIDLEDQLRFERSSNLPAVQLGWRISDDWILNAEYYALGRRTEATLDDDIIVGDTTYPVNGTVAAGFDSDVYRLTIGNLLIQRERFELGVAIGIHGTKFEVFIEGQGTVSGSASEFRREGRSIFAPLPTIGAFTQWEPAPRVTLGARIDWLSLTISDYTGRLINTEASVAYQLFNHVEIGALYRYVDYRIEVNKDDWKGEVRYKFSGPSLFIRAGF